MAFRPSQSTYFSNHDDDDDDENVVLTRSRQDTHALLSDPMMKLKWYHPFLTRHAAECMLIDNAPEGSYLIRPSTSENISEYALSVKFSMSVQHVKVTRLPDGKYQFAQSIFDNEKTFRKHFEVEKPIIGGENNVNVILKYPYSREINENHIYTELQLHAVTNMVADLEESSDTDSDTTASSGSYTLVDKLDTLKRLPYITPITSREGYLTKRGRVRKNWKVRWFVLRNNKFAYYKTKQSKNPIKVINMLDATSVEYDTSTNKDYCFRIVLPYRTFLIYANSDEDCEQWIELLRSKLYTTRTNDDEPNDINTRPQLSTPNTWDTSLQQMVRDTEQTSPVNRGNIDKMSKV